MFQIVLKMLLCYEQFFRKYFLHLLLESWAESALNISIQHYPSKFRAIFWIYNNPNNVKWCWMMMRGVEPILITVKYSGNKVVVRWKFVVIRLSRKAWIEYDACKKTSIGKFLDCFIVAEQRGPETTDKAFVIFNNLIVIPKVIILILHDKVKYHFFLPGNKCILG